MKYTKYNRNEMGDPALLESSKDENLLLTLRIKVTRQDVLSFSFYISCSLFELLSTQRSRVRLGRCRRQRRSTGDLRLPIMTELYPAVTQSPVTSCVGSTASKDDATYSTAAAIRSHSTTAVPLCLSALVKRYAHC